MIGKTRWVAPAMELLEREDLLDTLRTLRRRAAAGEGSLLFVEGEAGIGKTTLLRSFVSEQQHIPSYWGNCNATRIPRALEPLFDIDLQMAGELQLMLSGTQRLQIFTTFLDILAKRSVIVILEDLQWGDDATFDLLRYIGRRVTPTRSVLIGSFRSDEVGTAHPLHLILGDLATSGVRRLALQPLFTTALKQPARLVHHVDSAEVEYTVFESAPAAAREAAKRGAHRQAAQQFARALRFAVTPTSLRAELLDDYSAECQLSDQLDEAIRARKEAAQLWQDSGDTDRRAVSLTHLAHALVISGRNAEGEAAMQTALKLVSADSTTNAAVVTRRWAAHLRMLERDVNAAIEHGHLAMSIAQQRGDHESLIHCLNTIGAAMIIAGSLEEGQEYLEKSLSLAEGMQSDDWIADAWVNLGTACGEVYQFNLADNYLRRGIEFCAARDIDFARLYQLSWQALVWMYRGRWTEASGVAHVVLADQRSPVIARIIALVALGRVRARRGEPAVWDALNEARELAGTAGTLQSIALIHAARAEAAWFEGRIAEAAREATFAAELAIDKEHSWFASELLFWTWQSHGSLPEGVLDFCGQQPFALEITGCWREAAAQWRELGCLFETARALAEGDEDAQQEALSIFESFDSRPMIERVRDKLRVAGVRGPRRGPGHTHPTTRMI